MARARGQNSGEGWLVKEGQVIASTVAGAYGGHLARPDRLDEGIGGVVVHGPAFVVGLAVVRLGDDERLKGVGRGVRPRFVGPGRVAVGVRPTVAAGLVAGDHVTLRASS